MKKQLFSMSTIFAAVLMVSCNDNSKTGTSTTDTTSTTTTTTPVTTDTSTPSRMDTGMAGRTDTSMAGKTATAANNVDEKDRKFIMEAASGGMMEVQAGQLAA